MIIFVASRMDGQTRQFYDWFGIHVRVRCMPFGLIRPVDLARLDATCLLFGEERHLKRVRNSYRDEGERMPPAFVAGSDALAKIGAHGPAARFSGKTDLLRAVKAYDEPELASSERAEKIFIYIRRYAQRIMNLREITGPFTPREYRLVRDAFRDQFGLPMRRWLTFQKIIDIAFRIKNRKETGQYLSLARECGFRSDAALATFLRLQFDKNVSRIESEIKMLKKQDILEKLGEMSAL